MDNENFFVIAQEPGAENPSLPTWASSKDNPIGLDAGYDISRIHRREVADVPGAYQLMNVFSADEVKRFIDVTESLGYLKDAAVSLPREVRHNNNVTWVTDDRTERLIWHRIAHLAEQNLAIFDGKKPLGINTRFRFYRYQPGDYFQYHIDGDWPGSKVVGRQLIRNAYPDRYSQMTFLVLLSEGFEGGATRFLVDSRYPGQPARSRENAIEIDVSTPAGSVLCFPHGRHPLHCLHSSETIRRGVKYIIRSDLLFEL